MDFKYELPEEISVFLQDSHLSEIGIGCSNSQVVRIEKTDKIYFLKIAKKGLLTTEYNALNWLAGKLPVPKIVIFTQTDEAEYLVTEEIKGDMLCSNYYLDNPDLALTILVDAFNSIYNVAINDCPLNVSNDYKLALVRNNVDNDLIKDDSLKEETLKYFGGVRGLLNYLENNRFEEELCFSHGDTSLPNVFALGDKFSGFIDVGECGIADKWFDLAICEKSVRRNYGDAFVDKFYQALGINQDRTKIDYYLLMMELYL